MRQHLLILMAALLAIVAAGCRSNKEQVIYSENMYDSNEKAVLAEGHSAEALPKAVVYRTNGDYNQNVPITVNAQGGIVSYPAPTDLTASSTPLEVGDGWLLDRRGGIGPNTAFLDYTYSDYRAMKKAPTQAELKQHILPEAKVTEYKVLSITLNQALQHPSEIVKYIDK